MSEPTQLPRIPDRAPPRTETLAVSELNDTVPPHRPDPNIAARDRAGGGRTWTDEELLHRAIQAADRDSQVDAQADAPAEVAPPAHVPPFIALLATIIAARIQRACPVSPQERAAARSRLRGAQRHAERAKDELGRLQLALRREAAALREALTPVLGTGLTGEASALTLVALFGLVEAVLAGNGLQAATGINSVLAQTLGLCIAVILVVVFEGFGSALAGLVRDSRRATWIIAVILGAAVMVSGVAYVYAVTSSRTENQAIIDALTKGPVTEEGKLGTARSDEEPAPAERDLSFMIPLQALLMLGATLMAMRIELARDFNERTVRIEDLEDEIELARSQEVAARAAQERQSDQIEEVDQRVAAHTENEHAFYGACAQSYLHEYSLRCRAAGIAPREVQIPPAPDPLDAAVRLVDPPLAAARRRQRDGGAPEAPRPGPGAPSGSGETPVHPPSGSAPRAQRAANGRPGPAPADPASPSSPPRQESPATPPPDTAPPSAPRASPPRPPEAAPDAPSASPPKPASTGRPAWMS